MKSFIVLKNQERPPLPASVAGPDIRFTPALVRHFLAEFTQEGDVVFDPFAGFGTTLITAQQMGRLGFGIEIDKDKVTYARSQLVQPENLLLGDAQKLGAYSLPPFDFSITSPIFMGRNDRQDPVSGYAGADAYARYLAAIQDIYRQMSGLMKESAHAVIEVSNLKGDNGLTTLAWDIAAEVSKVLSFEGEVIAAWEDGYGYGYDHSYCLVFKKPGR